MKNELNSGRYSEWVDINYLNLLLGGMDFNEAVEEIKSLLSGKPPTEEVNGRLIIKYVE